MQPQVRIDAVYANLPMHYVQQPLLPRQLLYPLHTERGVPRQPLVNIADQVQEGQLLAIDEQGDYPLHAALAGKITAIESQPILHADSLCDTAIKLAVADTNTTSTATSLYSPLADDDFHAWLNLPFDAQLKQQWLALIRQAGVVGLGGAGFGGFQKLLAAQSAHTLLINACECEPIISCDNTLIQYHCDFVLQALLLITKLLQVSRCVVVIEDDKAHAIACLEQALTHVQQYYRHAIELKVIASRYPSGHERQLVYAVDGLALRASDSLFDQGYVNFNIATVGAMLQAIVRQQPLTHRIITLSNGKRIVNLPVYVGTPINELIDYAQQHGLHFDMDCRWRLGGPMNGTPFADLSAACLKTTNAILGLTQQQRSQHLPCIRCGDCVSVCPVNLLPQQLFWFAQQDDHQRAQRNRLADCIECGNCAYVCPSEIPLVQYYRRQKKQIQLQHQQQQAATLAKQRFQQRQQRLQLERLQHRQKLAEKRAEAKRKLAQRQKQTSATDANNPANQKTNAAIAAAQERAKKRMRQ